MVKYNTLCNFYIGTYKLYYRVSTTVLYNMYVYLFGKIVYCYYHIWAEVTSQRHNQIF